MEIKRDLQQQPRRVGYPRNDTDVHQICQKESHSRNIYKSKETYGNQKRPMEIKRDLWKLRETHRNQKRPTPAAAEIGQSNWCRSLLIDVGFFWLTYVSFNWYRALLISVDLLHVCYISIFFLRQLRRFEKARHDSDVRQTCQKRPTKWTNKSEETDTNQKRPV